MPLISLARTKSEVKENMPLAATLDAPKYPYGTSLDFDNALISKFETLQTAEVGDEVTVIAKGKITRKSENEEMDGDKRKNVDIQLTSMDIKSQDDLAGGFGEATS